MRLRACSLALLGLLGLAALRPVQAQVTAAPALMNFQGRLAKPDGTPVSDGTYSVQFALYDAVTGGNQKWTQTVSSVSVRNGSFAVLLSGFPAATFNGNLWLQIQIGTAPALTPRQQMVSVAFAMKANTVPDGSIGAAQVAAGSLTLDRFAPNAFNPLAWLLGGNSGTNPATNFLGTTDNQPLVFRANNTERMRLNASGNLGIGTAAPAFPLDIAGTAQMTGFKLPTGAGANNVLTSDASGVGTWNALTSLIAPNSITNAMIQSVDYSKITNAPVNNGWSLTGNAGTTAANFLGTTDNFATAGAKPLMFKANSHSVLQIQYASLNINGNALTGVNTLGGSELNSISATTVGATIAGGGGVYFGSNSPNMVTGYFGAVGGGNGNTAGGTGSTIAGGQGNAASVGDATVGGGAGNTASGQWATIAGGETNSAGGQNATVGGGLRDSAGGLSATVGGGADNTASNNYATIAGGQANTASGIQSAVPGGEFNNAGGFASFAAGFHAKANNDGAFVWSDSAGTDFASTANNQFNIRASGGVRIFSNSAATTGVLLAAGSGSWSSASDRNLKANFQKVDTLNTLEKLLAIPLTTWNYKANANIRHIGVMAQDFYAAFGGLGLDDRHIDTVDADGVALAAIQGLNHKLESSNAELRKENSQLKARLDALERAVRQLSAQPK